MKKSAVDQFFFNATSNVIMYLWCIRCIYYNWNHYRCHTR